MENEIVSQGNKEKILTAIFTGVFASLYLACFIFGAVEYPHQVTSTSPLLVMLSALGGMVLAFLPYLCKNLLKIKLSFFTNLFIQLFGLMGFIGRNGAGKTTTLKCIYNLISPTSGEVLYQGKNIRSIEQQAKSEIGLLFGEIEYYPNKRVGQMSKITASFYPSWDQNRYLSYLHGYPQARLQISGTRTEEQAHLHPDHLGHRKRSFALCRHQR